MDHQYQQLQIIRLHGCRLLPRLDATVSVAPLANVDGGQSTPFKAKYTVDVVLPTMISRSLNAVCSTKVLKLSGNHGRPYPNAGLHHLPCPCQCTKRKSQFLSVDILLFQSLSAFCQDLSQYIFSCSRVSLALALICFMWEMMANVIAVLSVLFYSGGKT